MGSPGPLRCSLTRRENDILLLLSQNLTDREMAERLVLSLNSVKWYVRQIYGKLGVANRKEAVDRAYELNLFTWNIPPASPDYTLPRQLTSFVGREKEIEQVVGMVREHPLVTLTGAGGVGKTRLALQAVKELVDAFPDGVWWVELAPVIDPFFVPIAVASIFKVHSVTGQGLAQTLREYFASKCLLLILDNCEHLIDAVAELSTSLLEGSPKLSILATSREILDVEGEFFFRCPSLSLPDSSPVHPSTPVLKRVEASEAVRLFVDRAAAASPGFLLTENNAATITKICQCLDGIPLAIELSAARLHQLSLEQIAGHMDDVFGLLAGSRRSVLPRHKTLKALIDWSYQLLSPPEQILLRRLSVFAGGWTLEAAEAICADAVDCTAREKLSGAVWLCQEQIINLLGELINQSLVYFEPSSGEGTRYRILETVRQYARDRLEESGGVETVRARHLAYFLSLGFQAESHLRAKGAKSWNDQLEMELDNLRMALEWSHSCSDGSYSGAVEKGLQLATSLHWFWFLRSHLTEGVEWLERLLEKQKSQDNNLASDLTAMVTRGKAINVFSNLLRNIYLEVFSPGLIEKKEVLEQESLAIFQMVGEGHRRDYAICRYNQAKTVGEVLECRSLFLSVNDSFWTAECDERLAQTSHPNLEKSIYYMEENLALRKKIGDMDGEGYALYCLGSYEFCQGNLDRANALMIEARDCVETVGDKASAVIVCESLAMIAVVQNDYLEATRQLAIAHTIAKQINSQPLITDCLSRQAYAAWSKREFEQAIHDCGQALELSRGLPNSLKYYSFYLLGRVALSRGEFLQAKEQLKKVIQPEIFINYSFGYNVIQAVGVLLVQEGYVQQAVTLFGAQDALCGWLKNTMSSLECGEYNSAVASAHNTLGEHGFDTAWESGRAMTEGQAIRYALECIRE